ncbi:reverse transcriptase domain-containing protein [Tanacetum coccineum]
MSKPNVNKEKVIIEDWNSDDEDVMSKVSPVKTKEIQTIKTQVDKISQTSKKARLGFKKVKACFVCKSTDHLIKYCNFYDKRSPEPKLRNVVNTGQRVVKPIWDNAKRVNHKKNSNKLKYPQVRRTFVPLGVLTRTGAVSTVRLKVNNVRPNVSTVRPKVNPVRPNISTDRSVGTFRPIYPSMDNVRPRASYSPIKRFYYTTSAFRPKDLKQDIKTFRVKNMTTVGTRAVVSTGKDKMDNVLKKSKFEGNTMEAFVAFVSDTKGGNLMEMADEVIICLELYTRKAFCDTQKDKRVERTLHKIFLKDNQYWPGTGLDWIRVTQELVAKAMDDVSRQAFEEEKRRITSQKKAAQATNASDTLPNDRIFIGAYDDDEDVGAEADFNNMDNTIAVSPIPTLRIHKDHPKGKILGDPTSAIQTRGKIQKASSAQQALKNPRLYHKPYKMKAGLKQLHFFYGTIEEEVYVHQPPGFVDLAHPNKVYKVIKALYGLHQAPRASYEILSSFLLENGFTRAYSDSDYGGASLDRKSTTGGCQFLGRRLISWQCKKQTIMANSTTEAEYVCQAANYCGQSTPMAILESCAEHNMVAYLEKTDGNTDFHEIIDFLTRSSIHYALTVSLVVSSTFVEQFWMLLNQNNQQFIDLLDKHSKECACALTTSLFNALTNQHETQPDLSPRPLPTIPILDSIPEGSSGNHGGQSSSDRSLSGNEDGLTLQSVYDLCVSLCKQVTDQAKEIKHLKAQIKKLKKKAKPVITHHKAWMKSVSMKQRLAGKKSLKKKWMQKESVSKQGRKPAKFLYLQTEDLKRGEDKRCGCLKKGQSEKRELVTEDQIDPRVTSTRSVLTLKPLPKIDPKDKGKKVLEEEAESDAESEGVDEAERKFDQLAKDEEIARKVQEDWEAEEEMKKLAEEEATKAALIQDFDDIQARIEADRLLAARLQEEERETFTVEERAKFLYDTIAAQRRFLAQQRAAAIRSRPPTRTQLRNQMMTYLKHVGGKKHADLKNKNFEEIQVLYKKVKRFDKDFIAIGSAKDERQIKEMNEESKDPKKKRVVNETPREEDTAKVPAEQEVTEQGTKKRKSGHVKMIARKRPRPQPDDDSDDEHRKCLRIDLFHLYDLVMKQYSKITPEGIELILWGDLKIMMESSTEENDQGDFWNNQQDWEIVSWRLYEACGVCILELKDGTVIYMLVERRYPLSKELLQRMLDLGLEVEEESTAALHLVRFIKQQLNEEHQELTSPEANGFCERTDDVKLQEPWILFTDGSSCVDGSGAGLILTNPEGMEFTYALRFEFTATNNEAEYEALIAGLRIAARMGVRNLEANVDSRLVANHVLGEYVAKEDNMIQYLDKTRSLIQGFDRFTIRQVPRGDNKKANALNSPLDKIIADALSKITSTSFAHLSKQVLVEILKNKSIAEMAISTVIEEQDPTWMTPIVEFISKGMLPHKQKDARRIRRTEQRFELRNGVLYRRSFQQPWLRCVGPIQADYVLREIHEGSCIHRPIPRQPQQELTPITSLWPFHKWGIDILGPFPVAAGGLKFLIVATITGNQDGDLSHVLWAHRTTIKVSTGDTPFSLVYGTEAVIPAEIGMPTIRTAEVNIATNDDERRIDLDILEERREQAAIREEKAKLLMKGYYDAKVRGVSFRPGDFVYRANDSSHAEDTGKLGPKWEGPYEVTEALGKGAYKLRDMDGRELPRTWNICNLKKCYL